MTSDSLSTKRYGQMEVEPPETLADIKARLSRSPDSDPLNLSSSPEAQARAILRKIVPEEILSDQEDTKYFPTFLSWSQKEPEEYAVAIHKMKVQKGKEFADGFLKYLERKGRAGLPDFRKLGMKEFTDMLEYADWLKPNPASSIINSRLWMGNFDPHPQFRLRLALPGLFALRLNGYALHPPQADTATCDLYGVTTVLPNLYAGVRYKGVSSDTPLCTLSSVTLGNVMTLKENSGLTGTRWSDTGYILVADMFRTPKDLRDRDGSTGLYFIYNFTHKDSANGTAFNVSNEERSKTVLKLEGSPRNVLVPIYDKLGVLSPDVSVTPESYHEPEFVQLGIDGPFHYCKPIPLFPKSGS